ncbi:MAG: chitobiase/beta-hexosaminidase C-terminal domain-containing protein [Saprospiraceae bacterium]|nr:chitobiase/beta-hexosaminidase C-terminal domain-containing protein [Saprospiraceae bacterium]
MLTLLGRLHLLLLHLPIGLLAFALLFELTGRYRRRPENRNAARLLLGWGALTAVLSASCGWLLAQEGGYDEDLLWRHQWLGFATAGLAVAAWLLRHHTAYLPVLVGCVAALIATGHFGGSLTHGEHYLFEKKEDNAVAAAVEPARFSPQSLVYQDIIQPILKAKCQSCHRPGKTKGGLDLSTPEGLQRGGENGAIVLAGQPDKSPLLQKILLPLHHDDHMPPAGKPQPTPDEIALLRWWVAQGADFQKTLGQMSPDSTVAAILSGAGETPQNPVFSLNIPAAGAADLEKLRAAGASVMPLGVDQPWLAVSFAGNRKLDAQSLSALRPLARQVVDLDLSNTNLDAVLWEKLPEMPHLTRLHLARTQIGDASLKKLSTAAYLEFLNLTGAPVSDNGLAALTGLKHLRALYCWQTDVTPAGLQQLGAQLPALKIDSGAPPDTNATPLPLRPPKILFARNIFEDTVQVALDFPKLVGVYYTLDEASPTTQSFAYEGKPLIFNQTTKIRAIAAKPGWANSPIVEASFVKRKYKVASATLAAPPSPKYPGDGARSLYDGRISDNHFDKAYLGYEGEHLTATLDLGETREVGRVSVHCLENNNSWIFAPRGLHVWTSADGKAWTKQLDRQFPVNSSMQDTKAHLFSEPFAQPTACRFLKVQVESLLKNPPWHPGKGQKCWVFVDEILVE